MAWRAYLTSVMPDDPVLAADTTSMTVRFEDTATTPTRVIMRDYTFAGSMSITEMKNTVVADRDKLRALDTLKAGLVARVGQEIT